MARGPSTFKLRDFERALKAAKRQGFKIVKMETLGTGQIAVTAMNGAEVEADQVNPWDEALAEDS